MSERASLLSRCDTCGKVFSTRPHSSYPDTCVECLKRDAELAVFFAAARERIKDGVFGMLDWAYAQKPGLTEGEATYILRTEGGKIIENARAVVRDFLALKEGRGKERA